MAENPWRVESSRLRDWRFSKGLRSIGGLSFVKISKKQSIFHFWKDLTKKLSYSSISSNFRVPTAFYGFHLEIRKPISLSFAIAAVCRQVEDCMSMEKYCKSMSIAKSKVMRGNSQLLWLD